MLGRFAVFYRSIPASLEAAIVADAHASYVKDGIKRSLGHDCPRMTVCLENTGDLAADKKRLASFKALLEQLQLNNQIVSFSHISKNN